jgi:hypothetical protein
MSREDEWLDAIDLTRKQEAEIAALKAERDNWKALAERSEERVNEVKTEREKLITAGMEALAREAELRTECNRLLAALERLYNEFSQSNDFRPDSRVAREARRALDGKV